MLFRNFSHIYIEEEARSHSKTEEIIKRFPKSTIIPIDNYKEIFNRNQQTFSVQKASQKLILAKRKNEFLYKGSNIAPDFGHESFYYNTLALNCIYDCEYCYLQGMFPSAHLVLFVNNEDFLDSTDQKLQEVGSLYLCLSYDTDLLAFEHLHGYCKEWIEFSRKRSELLIEIRTKSVAINSLENTDPHPGIIFSWTLSPASIAQKFEHGTPSTTARIKTLKKMSQLGWKVRVCIDPIISITDDWKKEYDDLLKELFTEVKPEDLTELSLGSFRIGEGYYKKLQKVRSNSPFAYQKLTKQDGVMSLPKDEESQVVKTVEESAQTWLPAEKIVQTIL